MKNIYETIKQGVLKRDGNAIALEDGHSTLSYSDLIERVDRLAEFLAGCGMKPVDRVALFCSDSIDYVIASLAILSLRAVVIPVPASSAPHEVDNELVRIDADCLLFEKQLCGYEGNDIPESLLVDRRLGLMSCSSAAVPCNREFVELNPAFIRFSSGTTGQSKGVLLSHEAIHDRTNAADKGMGITADDTVLWVLSMSYHFVVSILLFLRRGATICLCYGDFPLSLLKSIHTGKGTFIYAAPFHYYTMAKSAAFDVDSLRNVRMAISTSMKLQEDVAQAFASKFGFDLSEAYGIIEVGLPFINHAPRETRGSVGQILPDYELTLRNRDAEGIGEIHLRGRGMFSAYVSPWKMMHKGTWFNTGDLGRLDENGNLYIVGRRKSLINFMGMKVFPEEVEAVLDAHPCVEESLVFGRPHARYGQLPCAKVVRCGAIDESTLVEHCLRELSPHMVPKFITFVEGLPKTASGKLCRDGVIT